MVQNIYDNPDFFREYSRMERSLHGLSGAAEWESLGAMLPELRGARVLDLGCGFGWFSRWAREQGAQGVLGLEISEKMLARAVEMTADAAITYEQMDLESVQLPESSFDLAFSSLVVHYLEDLDRFFASVYRALVRGGWFVFSTEHPVYTAPRDPAWIPRQDGQKSWPVDQYLVEGPRVTDWLVDGVVKQHRTMGTMINAVLRAGFTLNHVEEWGPDEEQLAAHPEWSEHRDRPMFLLMSARKPSAP